MRAFGWVEKTMKEARMKPHLVVGFEQCGKDIESLVSYQRAFISTSLRLAELLQQFLQFMSWKVWFWFVHG
jgi:hypothetical protein